MMSLLVRATAVWFTILKGRIWPLVLVVTLVAPGLCVRISSRFRPLVAEKPTLGPGSVRTLTIEPRGPALAPATRRAPAG